MMVLGAIFVIFAMAPALVPGGVPTGPLEFGGKGWNAINGLELLLGGLIIVVGASIWKFASRHLAILAAGVVLVFVLSVFAVLSSLNSTLTITGVDVTIQYGAYDGGYFGAATQTFPIVVGNSSQSLIVDEGSPFTVSFSISEPSTDSGNDGIAQIKATTPISGFPFEVASIRPALPIVLTPGSTVRINATVTAPYYSAGQSCPPQYCHHNEYNGPVYLVLTTIGENKS
jgi:hypothetical protein